METTQLPDRCPKCGQVNPHAFNTAHTCWRWLFCGSHGSCTDGDHMQAREHLYVRCYCGFEFGFRPCEDAKEKDRAA